MTMTILYLVWHEPASASVSDRPISWDGDAYPLNDCLWLVRSTLSRSKLYHQTKWQLPPGSALVVAPLDDRPEGWPKFKGMRSGADAWLRSRATDEEEAAAR